MGHRPNRRSFGTKYPVSPKACCPFSGPLGSASGELGAPFLGAYVPGVARKKPVVAVEISAALWKLALLGFLRFLDDLGTCRLGPVIVRFHRVDALGSTAEL